jgi:hypothetical protein
MRLATLPDQVIEGLVTTVAAMPRPEVERFVAELRSSQDFRERRTATLNVRRAMQAYRAVTLIDDVDDEVRGTLELTLDRVTDLLGITLRGCVSQANTGDVDEVDPPVHSRRRGATRLTSGKA